MRYAEPYKITLTKDYGDYGVLSYEYYTPPTATNNLVDESYPEWDENTQYTTGDYVKVDELKRIFRATTDVQGTPPIDSSIWVDYGAVNSYKMLMVDQVGEKTTGTDIFLEFNARDDERISVADTIAFLGIKFKEVVVKLYDYNDDLIREESIRGADNGAEDFAEYFYDPYLEKDRLILRVDECGEAYRITFNFSEYVEIGAVCFGCSDDLGCTLYGVNMEFQDRSKIKTDEFTNQRIIIRYGHIRVVSGEVVNIYEDRNIVATKIDKIVGKNVIFLPDEKDVFSAMTNLGYIESFNMPINNKDKVISKFKIVGVVA